jgi:tRNA 2-thiouridine synthesizing protein A
MSKAIPEQFVELLVSRDFPALAATVAPDARARLLLPHGLEEHLGRDAIAGRIESWFGSASDFQLTSSSAERVGARHRLSWRFSVVREPGRREDVEQLVFVDVGPGGIERLDLVCSGFQTVTPGAPTAARIFDAGAMGCADGLAQEFRRRLEEVPVGESISVVVRDPAAKEDLPALARMLGQSVTSVEAHDDGRLQITVERIK